MEKPPSPADCSLLGGPPFGQGQGEGVREQDPVGHMSKLNNGPVDILMVYLHMVGPWTIWFVSRLS